MRLYDRLHALHRVWRYRLRTERDELKFLLGRDLQGHTVVDVGANRGSYSYWMHKAVGTQGHVVAFEPQPELNTYLQDLRATFKLNQLTIVPCGLSSHPEETNLVRPRNHWGAASLHMTPNEHTDIVPVKLTTLDDYFANSSVRPIRFMKVDAQGHELEIFRGGERVLREDKPDLLFEAYDYLIDGAELVPFLDSLGYDGFFLFEGQLTPISRLAEFRPRLPRKVSFFNYIFLPRAKAQSQPRLRAAA